MTPNCAYHRNWRESTFFNSIGTEGSMFQLSLFSLLLFSCSLGIRPRMKIEKITMRTNLPKLLDLLIFCTYLLNFSLEFFIMIFFATNQLNISKFLPTQIRKTLISYYLKPNYTNLIDYFS